MRVLRWITLLLLASVALPAQAGSMFSYQVLNQLCLKGRDTPGVQVTANEAFKAIEVEVTRSDGKELKLGPRAFSEGQSYTFTFSQGEGEYSYEGVIRGTYPDGDEYEVPIDFTIFVGGNLDMQVPRDDIDLDGEILTMILTRPAGKAEIEIYGLEGMLAQQEYTLDGEAAGTPINLEWDALRGEVVKMVVRGYDKWGFFVQEDITPWSLEIPHDDVHFETGKHDILDSEKPKLDNAFADIMEKVEQYGHIVDVKLFIGGYTDTVSDRGYNQTLSNNRAKSIARHFRANGFTQPIYYQGFGEDALAVETDDSVEEVRNRRAVYLLAAWPPRPGKNFPRGNWQKL